MEKGMSLFTENRDGESGQSAGATAKVNEFTEKGKSLFTEKAVGEHRSNGESQRQDTAPADEGGIYVGISASPAEESDSPQATYDEDDDRSPKTVTNTGQKLRSSSETAPITSHPVSEAAAGAPVDYEIAGPRTYSGVPGHRATHPGAERVPGINARDGDRFSENEGADGGTPAPADADFLASTEITWADQEDVADPFRRYRAPEGSTVLAVAREVPEGGDESLPATIAVQYDIDAKPRPYCSSFCCLYVILFVLVTVAVVVGVCIVAVLGSKNGKDTANNTVSRAQAQIELVVGSRVLADPKSPYSKALEWITEKDPMQLTPGSSPSFIQRYIAAYFYFATSIDGNWTSCNPPDDPWSGEGMCTVGRPNETKTYRAAHAWLSNVTECKFAGMYCNELGQIKTIDCSGFGLSGSFPKGIYNWPSLGVISLNFNSLRGRLPSDLFEKLPGLNDINLVNNEFTGTIPLGWWSTPKLRVLLLTGNKITGTIPTIVGNLTLIKYMRLSNNHLTGTIPSEIGMRNSLSMLRLSNNELTGAIPSEIGKCGGLSWLRLDMNELTGTIPSTFGNLRNLRVLKLHTNPMLTGHLPESLFGLPYLTQLDVMYCGLSGTLSPLIGDLGDTLGFLRLSRNKFHGRIPTELALLSRLRHLRLDGNDFTGSISRESCKALKYAASTDFFADCAPDSRTGDVKLNCTCCSHCCEPGGYKCLPVHGVV